MANVNGLEIERKFLIKYPDIKLLKAQRGCRIIEIEQSYLKDGGRARKICEEGKVSHIKTVKKHITDIKRQEKEWEISKEEFAEALNNRAEGTQTIVKTRYAFPLDGFIFEVDIFPFWNDRAFLEVELEREDEAFPVPEFLEVIKEVTCDKRYTNSSLARKIIIEDII